MDPSPKQLKPIVVKNMIQINKLGVVIVLISLIASLFIGVITNTTTETSTVTDYNYVADVSQTFNYSDMPDYMEYNPSANYSGYLRSDGRSSGVAFTTATGASNYRMADEVTSVSNSTYDITNLISDNTDVSHSNLSYVALPYQVVTDTDWNVHYLSMMNAHGQLLSTLIEKINEIKPATTQTYTVTFKSGTLAAGQSLGLDSNMVSFCKTGTLGGIIYSSDSYGVNPYYMPYIANGQFGNKWYISLNNDMSRSTHLMGSSSLIDNSNNTVSLTYDVLTNTAYRTVNGVTSVIDPTQYTVYWYANGLVDKVNFEHSNTTYTGFTTNIYVAYETTTYSYMKINDGVRINNTDSTLTTNWTNGNANGIVDVVFGKNNSSLMGNGWTLGYSDQAWDNVIWGLIRENDGPNYLNYDYYGNGSLERTQYELGIWDHLLIRFNAIEGKLSVYPVTDFNSYTDFTISNNPLILDDDEYLTIPTGDISSITWHSVTTDPGALAENGDGLTSYTITVSDTTVALANKLLMVDPSITISDYFTDANTNGWRLNFYSFAKQGTSMTINGNTYPVSDGKITVGDKSYKLNNIYVSYDTLTDHIYLTFAKSNTKVDLGQMTTDTISMAGVWFFSTAYYDAEVTTSTTTQIQWTKIPPMGTVALIFIGITAVLMAFGIKKIGFTTPDYMVTIIAIVVAFGILEVFS